MQTHKNSGEKQRGVHKYGKVSSPSIEQTISINSSEMKFNVNWKSNFVKQGIEKHIFHIC